MIPVPSGDENFEQEMGLSNISQYRRYPVARHRNERAKNNAGIDQNEMEKALEDFDFMSDVAARQAALEEAGHWGLPIMVINGEPLFGQDRTGAFRWCLDKLGIRKQYSTNVCYGVITSRRHP